MPEHSCLRNHHFENLRGRVSRYVTNGSKSAVMDVIGFLCVPLGSSTVQLHNSLGSRCACSCSEVGFSRQNGDRAWGVYYWRAAFCCTFFCGQNDSMQRMFIKKCFLFMVGSVCRVKLFTTEWQTFQWWRRGWNWDAEVTETTNKRLLCCGFRRTGKAMGQVYQCWWRICREIIGFPGFEYHMFYGLYPFVACFLTLPCKICDTLIQLSVKSTFQL
jgi:hypothetical protein